MDPQRDSSSPQRDSQMLMRESSSDSQNFNPRTSSADEIMRVSEDDNNIGGGGNNGNNNNQRSNEQMTLQYNQVSEC